MCSEKNVFVKSLQISYEKYLYRSQFLNKETPTEVFSCEICEIFRTPFLTEHLRWLLLYHCKIHLSPPVLFQAFLRPVKGLRTTRQILGVFFYFLFMSIVIYTSLFTLNCLYFLHVLIYTNVLFILLYELDKIVKIWGI